MWWREIGQFFFLVAIGFILVEYFGVLMPILTFLAVVLAPLAMFVLAAIILMWVVDNWPS